MYVRVWPYQVRTKLDPKDPWTGDDVGDAEGGTVAQWEENTGLGSLEDH